MFHNEVCFDIFLIRVAELFAEGSNNVRIGESNFNFSLFSTVRWLCQEHVVECQSVGLDAASQSLYDWLDHAPPFKFWRPHLNVQIKLEILHKELLAYGGNFSKHKLLRLYGLLNKLQRLCQKSGYAVQEEDLLGVLDSFLQLLRDYLNGQSIYLVAMLIRAFSTLNFLVIRRFQEGNTYDVRKMHHPGGPRTP